MSQQVQRVCQVIRAMVGHEASGIANKEIAARLAESATNISRALHQLKAAGFVESHPRNPNLVRLSADFVAMANTVSLNLSTAQKQLSQDVLNYSRIQ